MLSILILALYLVLPITLLTSHSLPSGVFYTLLATSLALLWKKRFAGTWTQTQKYRLLISSYGFLFLVISVSSLYHGQWAGANSEGALRFILGLWLLLLTLPHVRKQHMRNAIWGVYVGGLISTAIVVGLTISTGARPETPSIIIVSYSSIMLLLCAITVYSLKWSLTAHTKLESIVKILVAIVIFAGFLVAQTRTGLLGLPIFVLLSLVLFVGLTKPGRILSMLSIAGILAVVVVINTDTLRHRIFEGIHEVQTCRGDNSRDFSSMCIRLQMWRTAIDGGLSHPWLGLGSGGVFNQYMKDVGVPKGLVAQAVVDDPFGEPHNDLLLVFFGFGFPGVLGLLLIYIAPCTYLLPRLLNKDSPDGEKAAAAMGLAVCLGFLFFGLTETMFRRMNTIGFYTAMVALFMVLSEPRPPRQDKPAPLSLP